MRVRLQTVCCNVALLSLLSACNGVLGIHKPSGDVIVIGGSDPSEDAGSDAGGVVLPAMDGGAPSDVLGPHASWPMPNPRATGLPNPQAYTSDPAGFVTDEVTGLEWEQPIDSESLAAADAADHCASLRVKNGEAFRLPTRIELLSLLDFTATTPSIDAESFPDTPSDFFWTSSVFSSDASSSWVVSFDPTSGFLSSSQPDSKLHVRCVRASADPAIPHFTIEQALVVDSATKLHWQRNVSGVAYNWTDASKRCHELDLPGEGWRLPTVKELQTVVDEEKQMPSIDRAVFPATPTDAFWTSSRVADQAAQAWSVSFRFGFDAAADRNTPLFVRCVR